MSRAALALAALGAAACGPGPVTYARDVQPLVQSRCQGCHREGGIAPFALETYEQVAAQADAMRAATSRAGPRATSRRARP